MKARSALVLSGVLFPFVLFAQEQTPSFSVDVDAVRVVASVRDHEGRLVEGLTKDDFILEEEGEPQTIRYFSTVDNVPLALGLLVDTSFSQNRILGDERRASAQFLRSVLKPETDTGFLISFNFEVRLVEDLSDSREKLLASLDELEVPRERGPRGIGTTLYDAVFLSANEVLDGQTSRKAMILLSDGVDVGSVVDLDGAVRAAQQANSIIYTIRYSDPEVYSGGGGGFRRGLGRARRPRGIGIPGGGPRGGGGGRGPGGGPGRRPRPEDGKAALERLARETGGHAFEVSKKQPLDEILGGIERELRQQYVIGYTPASQAPEGEFRSVTVKTKRAGLTVQCRQGYYSGGGDSD